MSDFLVGGVKVLSRRLCHRPCMSCHLSSSFLHLQEPYELRPSGLLLWPSKHTGYHVLSTVLLLSMMNQAELELKGFAELRLYNV